MAYTFKSRSAASVTLLRANGDDILRLVGRTPSERGAIPAEDLPSAIAAIEAAIAPGRAGSGTARPAAAGNVDDEEPEVVTLRQRALPFLQLLREARAAGEAVTWGVV
jgi:cyclopropane-fatty-acyl-phospholipid synthase